MKVSREIKKKEALERMKMLHLFKPCITSFEKDDEVQLSEQTGGLYEFSDDTKLNEKIRDFEENHSGLVYHVIHTYTAFGELYNLLYVSDHMEEWDMDHEDLKDGYVLCYVWNKDDDWCSEFGTIVVREKFGGIVRVG